jgi:hypothetical protein
MTIDVIALNIPRIQPPPTRVYIRRRRPPAVVVVVMIVRVVGEVERKAAAAVGVRGCRGGDVGELERAGLVAVVVAVVCYGLAVIAQGEG